jgi:hypothetical protein
MSHLAQVADLIRLLLLIGAGDDACDGALLARLVMCVHNAQALPAKVRRALGWYDCVDAVLPAGSDLPCSRCMLQK